MSSKQGNNLFSVNFFYVLLYKDDLRFFKNEMSIKYVLIFHLLDSGKCA